MLFERALFEKAVDDGLIFLGDPEETGVIILRLSLQIDGHRILRRGFIFAATAESTRDAELITAGEYVAAMVFLTAAKLTVSVTPLPCA